MSAKLCKFLFMLTMIASFFALGKANYSMNGVLLANTQLPCPPAALGAGPRTLGFADVYVNGTSVAASDVCVEYAGTGGTLANLVVTANPLGCPAPVAAQAGSNVVWINWGVACVAPGAVVAVNFAGNFAPLVRIGLTWTSGGVPIPGQNPPPPQQIPASRPPIKIVPVKFCLLSDGVNMDTPAPNDGRFNRAKRLLGLLVKSLVFAQAGILFKPQGSVIVPDLIISPGSAPGDVLDPDINPLEWIIVKFLCNLKIGEDAAEKLVDILIRRWVDGAGMPSGNVGWSQVPPCTAVPRPTAKPTTNDPDTFTLKVPLPHPLDLPLFIPFVNIDNFPETLAHEDGHALCLNHVDPNLDQRLMNVTGFGNFVLDPIERANARAEAQKISGTIDKDKHGVRLLDPKPRSRISVDDLNDVPSVWIDIAEAAAVRKADGALALDMQLAGLIPGDIKGLKYVFMVDVDNNAGTGGSPDVGFPHGFHGVDLLVEITVSKVSGTPSVTAVVKRFEAGRFVEIVDSRIEAKLVTLIAEGKSKTQVPTTSFPIEEVVAFVLPADRLPLPLAEGYRVASFAFDSNTGKLDQAPIITGSITEFPEPQSITIKPIEGIPGDAVTITGKEFLPNSTVDIFFGTELVANIPTDGTGAFVGQFTVPKFGEQTFIFNPDFGEFVSPVTAVDRTEASDAVIFQLARCNAFPFNDLKAKIVELLKLETLGPRGRQLAQEMAEFEGFTETVFSKDIAPFLLLGEEFFIHDAKTIQSEGRPIPLVNEIIDLTRKLIATLEHDCTFRVPTFDELRKFVVTNAPGLSFLISLIDIAEKQPQAAVSALTFVLEDIKSRFRTNSPLISKADAVVLMCLIDSLIRAIKQDK
ncbi:hypothetical protein HYR54_10280 [Candidatus Acetothermia bacterium]|nr:hypothetical protein [Candidatus Acetothermia bacterium]